MRKNPITSPRYDQIYNFIVRFKIAHNGNSPTIRQIGDEIGVVSTSQVSHYLNQMVRLGKIERDGKFRMISIPGGQWFAPTPARKTN